MYAKTRRLPPHRTQANTSKSNVLRSSSAQSPRGVVSFIRRSFLAAASIPALSSSAWGTRNGRSLAPGAKTPWSLVRFARGGGTRDATRRKSSSPVKGRCVVPSGSGRWVPNGSKTWITNGTLANVAVVWAKMHTLVLGKASTGYDAFS
jgi:alkylation response protein AidB-like acyl-CoA dehydrogenase